MSRISSRRAFLTASAASTLAATGTLGAHVALAAVSEPDPMFALIEAERSARAAWDVARADVDRASEAFIAAGHNRKPSVKTGVLITVVDYPGDPSQPLEREEKDLFSCSRADIVSSYKTRDGKPIVFEMNGRRIATSAMPHGTCEEALAEFDAQSAAIADARARFGLDEAKHAVSAAGSATWAALEAVFDCEPTTTAGFLAMVDLALEYGEDSVDFDRVREAIADFVNGREA